MSSKITTLNEDLDNIYSTIQKARVEIKLVNKSKHASPAYETEGASGMDLRANLEDGEIITLDTLERRIIPTGLFVELPLGLEMQIRPRSGLAAKYGITVLNSPGTIDADYRGEIGVILVNLSNKTFSIGDGDRIAQGVIMESGGGLKYEMKQVNELGKTERNDGGFGSTGIK